MPTLQSLRAQTRNLPPSLEQIPRLPELILHGGQACLTGPQGLLWSRQADLVRNDIGLLAKLRLKPSSNRVAIN